MPPLPDTLPWTARLAGMLRAIGRFGLPAACLLCALPADADRGLCRPCATGLTPAPSPPERLPALAALGVPAVAPFAYVGGTARLLARYKFHGDLAAGRVLADLAVPGLAALPRPDALVPVPLHRSRLRQRGHDQALGLALDWGRALRIPVQAGLLQRVRATAPQTTLDGEARRRNLEAAFALRHGAHCPPHLALVDDVLTTGSTAAAAAAVLLAAGAGCVQVWAVAQAARAK